MAARGQSGYLTNAQTVRLAASISNRNLQRVALKFLDLDYETLVNIKHENRGDSMEFNRAILLQWAKMNTGANQVKVSIQIYIYLFHIEHDNLSFV